MQTARLTTAEAAQLLECEHAHALSLLKAAQVPCSRMGRRGPCLWQADGVKRLLSALGKQAGVVEAIE